MMLNPRNTNIVPQNMTLLKTGDLAPMYSSQHLTHTLRKSWLNKGVTSPCNGQLLQIQLT